MSVGKLVIGGEYRTGEVERAADEGDGRGGIHRCDLAEGGGDIGGGDGVNALRPGKIGETGRRVVAVILDWNAGERHGQRCQAMVWAR